MNIRKIARIVQCGFLVTCLLMTFGGVVAAQPLVTGDLSVYYSFDFFVDEVIDLSGNDPPLNGDVYGNIVRDDVEAVRGSSAFIDSAPNFIPEHFIAIGGCDQIENPEACDDIPDDRIPSTGYTVATWVNLQETGGDQSIHQAMSADGSFVVHAQAQGNGQIRLHLRGQQQSENIVAFRGGQYDLDDWIHFAFTYDQPNDFWAVYYNGEPIGFGEANGDAGAIPLGDWGRGSLIGMVPDRARQAYGHFDEYYVFTRAITPDEVLKLFNLEEPVTCDFNFDLECNTVDLDSLGTDIIAGNNTPEFDMNNDGLVNLTDQFLWRELAATTNGFAEPYLEGDSNLDGAVLVGDLNVVGTNWQSSSNINPWTHGDFNSDGMTNVADLNLLALNWQDQIAMAASDGNAVPEPSTLTLLGLAALAGMLARRRV